MLAIDPVLFSTFGSSLLLLTWKKKKKRVKSVLGRNKAIKCVLESEVEALLCGPICAHDMCACVLSVRARVRVRVCMRVHCCSSGGTARYVVVTCLVFRSVEKQRQSLLDPDSITN